jgi:hypothetical protein
METGSPHARYVLLDHAGKRRRVSLIRMPFARVTIRGI